MAKKKAESANGKERINKMDLVRQALATLGSDTSPVDIVKHLKETANVKMPVGMASNYKSSILKKLGQSPRRKRRKKGRPAAGEAVGVTKPSGDAISLKDIRTLHEISERLGRSRLRELLELVH
jgi:hypothetical protein